MPNPPRRLRVLAALFLSGLVFARFPLRAQQAPSSAVARLYRASVALAETSLRLHETDRAKTWLARAPESERGWEWWWLSAQADRSSAVVPLEGGSLSDVAVSPDGRLIATAMGDGRVHLLDATSLAIVRTLSGHTAAAWTPAFTKDGRRLATGSSDGTARIWDVRAGHELRSLPGNGRGVAAVAWSPDESTLAVASWDYDGDRGVWGTLNLYDPTTGERIRHIEHGRYPIASLTYAADGRRLFGGTWDSKLLVWDARTWGEPKVLPPPPSGDYQRIADFALSPDGRQLAIAYFDDRVRIWDLDSLTVVGTLYVPREGAVSDIADVIWIDDGARLVTVGGDLTVRVWSAQTSAQLATFHGHERPALTIAASPDGRRLYTGGSGGRLRVWDLEALDPSRTAWPIHVAPDATREGTNTVYDVAFDPRGERAVVTTFGGWLRIIDATTGREVRSWNGSDQAMVGVDWSPDGRWIASTDNDGTVEVWNAADGMRVGKLYEAGRQVIDVAFSPDGSLLAAPGDITEVRLWRVPSWEPAGTLVGGRTVQGISWSADGSLAVTSSDGHVRLWDARRRALLSTIEAGSGTPAVAWDADGRRLAVLAGRALRVWDASTAAWAAEWMPRSASGRSIVWSPDGERIAGALSGNLFEVWDADDGETLLRLPQKGTAWMADWRSDGTLVLIPLDGTVRLLQP